MLCSLWLVPHTGWARMRNDLCIGSVCTLGRSNWGRQCSVGACARDGARGLMIPLALVAGGSCGIRLSPDQCARAAYGSPLASAPLGRALAVPMAAAVGCALNDGRGCVAYGFRRRPAGANRRNTAMAPLRSLASLQFPSLRHERANLMYFES